MQFENPWKTAAEEPHFPYIGSRDTSTVRTNTLPMYLYDIITKAPKPPKPKQPPTTAPTEKSRIPRKNDKDTTKAGDPQKVQGGAAIVLCCSTSVLLWTVLVVLDFVVLSVL